MDRPPVKKELIHRAEKAREELPDILDAEVRQAEHQAAEDAVRWLQSQAQKLVPPPPRPR